MPLFLYTARTQQGEKTSGELEANDQRSAMLQLERKGFVPISVKEKAQGSKSGKERAFKFDFHRKPKRKMTLREVQTFTLELSDLLASGMTLGQALHTLSLRKTGRAQDVIVASLRDDIVQGASMSEALGKWKDSFSTLYISMIRAGEASGKVTQAMEQICDHLDRVQEAREKVVMALTYPLIVVSLGIGTMIFAVVFVIPRFTAIFESLGNTLPLSTRILIGMSDLLIKYGWAIAALIVVLVVLFQRAIKTEKGLMSWHRVLLKLPVVKQVVTANAYSHFARTLSALLENGVPVLSALSIVEDTVGNAVIEKEIREARDRVTDGATISKPLAAGNIFPRMLTDMLAVGEESGDISGSLKHIAKRYENDLDRSVKLFTTILEPLLIVFMAAGVGFIALSMLMAVFDMTSGLNV